MEAGFIVALVLSLLAGIVIGMRIAKPKGDDAPKGILNVIVDEVYGTPDLFLNLQVPVEDVVTNKYISFYVNVIKQNSQK